MRKLSEIIPIPIINIWKWADGNEYTIDDYANVELTAELAESFEQVEIEFKEHFESKNLDNGKGMFKVKKFELQHNPSSVKEEKTKDLNKAEKVLGDE